MLQPPCFLFCFLFISIIFMIPTPFNMVFTLSDTLITDIGHWIASNKVNIISMEY